VLSKRATIWGLYLAIQFVCLAAFFRPDIFRSCAHPGVGYLLLLLMLPGSLPGLFVLNTHDSICVLRSGNHVAFMLCVLILNTLALMFWLRWRHFKRGFVDIGE